MKRHEGAAERRKADAERDAREAAPLHARIEQMLTEARVILPGAQALLGFQLIIVLTGAFERLPEASRLLHGAALLCVASAVVLLITPAALHRIVWAGEDSEAMLRTGGMGDGLGLGAARTRPDRGCLRGVHAHFRNPSVRRDDGRGGASGLIGLWFAWPMAARRSRGVPDAANGAGEVPRRSAE